MDRSTSSGGMEGVDVHLGFWVDWSRGRIRGASITLTNRNGSLLIAFLALFTALIGNSFWRISCFFLHNYFSTPKAQDALYHQRQALLRNSTTPTDGAIGLTRVLWAWRKFTRQSLRRLLPVAVYATVCSALFAVAGIFSSDIAMSTHNQVLISSETSGMIDPYILDIDTVLAVFTPVQAQETVTAFNYVLQCYRHFVASGGCDSYVKERLESQIDRNASCPFNDSVCRSKNGNIRLDSGYLNSHHDLGINAPPESRFLYRIVNHCAPLVTAGFTELKNTTETRAPAYMRYYYGEQMGVENSTMYNFTYQYPNNTGLRIEGDDSVGSSADDYNMGAVSVYGTGDLVEYSNFKPIPQLQRPDADLSLIFLSANQIAYTKPTDDFWFAAHQTSGDISTIMGDSVSWGADQPASPLGCASQVQFCNPNLPEDRRCTGLGSIGFSKDEAKKLWDDAFHQDLAYYSTLILRNLININDIIDVLGVSALTARYKLRDGLQGPLPDNQWQLEVEHWHNTTLAHLQGLFVNVAAGPRELEQMKSGFRKAKGPARERMTQNQKVLSAQHTSFSVLGLCLTLIMGTLILVIDNTIEPLASWIQKRRNSKLYPRLEWSANATLQLQRLAHEPLGYGTWSKATGFVPLTQSEDRLGSLEVHDPEHPVLESSRRIAINSRLNTSDLISPAISWKTEKTLTPTSEKMQSEQDIKVTVTEGEARTP